MKWTKELVLETVKEKIAKGESLKAKDMGHLYAAVQHYFGSYQGLEKFGITYETLGIKRKQKRGKKQIIAEIQKLHERGESLRAIDNRVLEQAARKYFGSYNKAIQDAGLDCKKLSIRICLKRDKEQVLEELEKIHSKGEPLNSSYVNKHYSWLAHAAKRLFGSYRKAIEAVGLDYDRDVRKLIDWRNWVKELSSADMERLENQILTLSQRKENVDDGKID